MPETIERSLDPHCICERQRESYLQPSRHAQCLPKTGTAIALDIREGEDPNFTHCSLPTRLYRAFRTQAFFSAKLHGEQTNTATSKSSLKPGII
jgi:hypothetical protein